MGLSVSELDELHRISAQLPPFPKATMTYYGPKVEAVTREPQYQQCFEAPPVTLGPMTGWTWSRNPLKLGMMLARYKFVAKMLDGREMVAEIGCGDGFGSAVVRHMVGKLDCYDFDPVWTQSVLDADGAFTVCDIVERRLHFMSYDAIYMLDLLEHITPEDEPRAMANVCASLTSDGVFIAGCPSLESQAYAAEVSKAGHVNCRTGTRFRDDMKKYFHNVFLFSMSDEVVHTGFYPMAHYLIALCVGPKNA